MSILTSGTSFGGDLVNGQFMYGSGQFLVKRYRLSMGKVTQNIDDCTQKELSSDEKKN